MGVGMASDFGISVAPEFRESRLWEVSALAIRTWLYLASRACHDPMQIDVSGHKVALQAGEVALSMRVLRGEIGCGISQLTKAIRDLVTAGAVEAEPVKVKAKTFPKQEHLRSQTENVQRSCNGNGHRSLLTRFKVCGVRTLPRKAHVLELGTKSNYNKTKIDSTLEKSRRERDRMMEELAAEGR
jgi:hypothetical protein